LRLSSIEELSFEWYQADCNENIAMISSSCVCITKCCIKGKYRSHCSQLCLLSFTYGKSSLLSVEGLVVETDEGYKTSHVEILYSIIFLVLSGLDTLIIFLIWQGNFLQENVIFHVPKCENVRYDVGGQKSTCFQKLSGFILSLHPILFTETASTLFFPLCAQNMHAGSC
jgi:hypothetical protein